MNRLNQIIAVIFVLMSVVACHDSSQKPVDEYAPSTASTKESTTTTKEKVEPMHHSEKVLQKGKPVDAEDFCELLNVETWFGFDENSAEPMCHTVKFYQLKSYHCDISKQAFGLEEDAIYIEKASSRIFAYSSEDQCIEALEVRNANAP